MTYADRIPAPRPVPTTRERLTDARRPTPHLDAVKAERDEALEARDVLRAQLDTAQQTATYRQGVIDSQAAQLRANGTLLCRLRDLDEQRDRAWADHDTVSEVSPVEAHPGSPSPRAQDEPEMVRLAGWGGGHSRVPARPHSAQDDQPTPTRVARQQLDQALRDALPLSGGKVRGLLKALRRELERADAKRSEQRDRVAAVAAVAAVETLTGREG